MDDEQSPLESAAETAVEAVAEQTEHLEEHTEEIKQEVAETPAEDIDSEWKRTITAQLETLSTEIRELRAVIPQPSSVSENLHEAEPETEEEVREIVLDAPKEETSPKRPSRRLLRRRSR